MSVLAKQWVFFQFPVTFFRSIVWKLCIVFPWTPLMQRRPHFSAQISLLVNTVDQNDQEAWTISNMLSVHSMLNVSVFSPLPSHCSTFFLFSVALTTPQHLCYPRAAPENSCAVLCTIQELVTWTKKKMRGWCFCSSTKEEMSLTNNALLSSFIPDTNIFFKSMIYKNKYLFHVCTHTTYSERVWSLGGVKLYA